ncbi:unnamed protein product [Blepharisma stoltei]|uniref:Uncharacterized protein n=1 Tax=Blepharisma stoltei TaxID=1481888 RepID=A0AAU9JXZ0_9CILI|nr:unnamed protein product [Blepharisma stoltei]
MESNFLQDQQSLFTKRSRPDSKSKSSRKLSLNQLNRRLTPLCKSLAIKNFPSWGKQNENGEGGKVFNWKVLKTSLYTVEDLKERLENQWEESKIPSFMRDLYKSSIYQLPENEISSKITSEIFNLKNGTSIAQKLIESIQDREIILEDLKKGEKEIQSSSPRKDSLEKASVLLNAYRLSTLVVIENITQWKNEASLTKSTSFIWDDADYFEKIIKDSDYISSTNLHKYFNLKENDPLLGSISNPINNEPSQSIDPNFIYLPASSDLLSRINDANQILLSSNFQSAKNESKIIHRSHKNLTTPPSRKPRTKSKIKSRSSKLCKLADDIINKSSEKTKVKLKFDSNGENVNWENLWFKPINVYEKNISPILGEYYNYLPEMCRNINSSLSLLFLEIKNLVNPCFYWICFEQRIVGLLVYTLDCSSDMPKIVINHLSCLVWEGYLHEITAATKFLLSNYDYDEIRINLFTYKDQEITKQYKTVFSGCKYNWKSTILNESAYKITVMGTSRSKIGIIPTINPSTYSQISIKAECETEISKENILEITEININNLLNSGNRQCFVKSLLDYTSINEYNSSSINTGVNREIDNLIFLLNGAKVYHFPYINKIFDQKSEFLTSGFFEINLFFPGCTYFAQRLADSSYQLMRIKSDTITRWNFSDYKIFYIQTNLPKIQAFVIYKENLKEKLIENFNANHYDLFKEAADILKFAKFEEEIEELCIPCFSKEAEIGEKWMLGYKMPGIQQEYTIKKCKETINIKMHQFTPSQGLLKISRHHPHLILNDFIFGLSHLKSDDTLDIPLFVSFIEKSDFLLP